MSTQNQTTPTTDKLFSTGGILNRINELYKCNSKYRSVPVMSLIRSHNPKNNDELVFLISSHQKGHRHENCECKCKSAGTLKDFGKNLYDAQLDYFSKMGQAEKDKYNFNEPYSLEHCEMFMYTLFISCSLKGDKSETRAVNKLNASGELYHKVEIAPELLDFKYGVDIVAKDKHGKDVCGIQVKPESYMKLSENHPAVMVNLNKNKAWGKPVIYLYYNMKMEFLNFKDVVREVNEHIESLP